MIVDRIETRICKYVFTEEEKRDLAQDMANGVCEVQRLEDHKKAVMSQLKAEIDAKQGLVNLAAEKMRSGFEMREVECKVIYEYDENEVVWVRTDDGKVAHHRQMRPDERQRPFDEDQGCRIPWVVGAQSPKEAT